MVARGIQLGTPTHTRRVPHPPIRRPSLTPPPYGLRRRRVTPAHATDPQSSTTTTQQEDTSLEALYDASHKLDKREGPSTDLGVVIDRFWKLAMPYWTESEERDQARWRLGGVVALTLACTGVSVLFNFLGRDFFNALSEKDVERFTVQLYKWFAAVLLGVPVFVYRDYYQSKLALEWREWMTKDLTDKYMANRTFYKIQSEFLVDNPDQRISADIRAFTDTAVSLSVVVLNSIIDLVSFSEILYSIYPPLFVALVVYSVGGTWVSVKLGQPLVGLNFKQEAQEADLRYGLVRIRENSESIAFYGGERSEARLLGDRLRGVVANYGELLIASRNLSFFTGGYRYLIQILPAAVIAPLYFQGRIQFGVINQSLSAFNHILSDVSLIVYQFESLAGFSAVVDRLGEFCEVVDSSAGAERAKTTQGETTQGEMTSQGEEQQLDKMGDNAQHATQASDGQVGDAATAAAAACTTAAAAGVVLMQPSGASIRIKDVPINGNGVLLNLQDVTLLTPNGATTLVKGLSLQVHKGDSLLLMGPSGTGKTSLLRAIAGLWDRGSGCILRSKGVRGGLGEDGGAVQGHHSEDNTPTSSSSINNTTTTTTTSNSFSDDSTSISARDIMFVPQRPYMVLGSLRDQLLYPTWADLGGSDDGMTTAASGGAGGGDNGSSSSSKSPPTTPQTDIPTDAQLEEAMHRVRLSEVLQRVRAMNPGGSPLDVVADWASKLSLGEQQRLAFARVLLTKPALLLMDESTSALDTVNEAALYDQLRKSGVTFISVGHRPTLVDFHDTVLYMERTLDGEGGEGTPQGARWELKSSAEAREQLKALAAMTN